MTQQTLTVTIKGDAAKLARVFYGDAPRSEWPVDGWLAPRRSRVVLIERSRGFLHLWVGPFGLHLARPLHRSRLDFCADWWR